MSWADAQKEARRWIDSLNIPTRSLKGKSINLTEQVKKLKHEPVYKRMVTQAAQRLLKTRGVEMIVDKEEPPPAPPIIPPEPED